MAASLYKSYQMYYTHTHTFSLHIKDYHRFACLVVGPPICYVVVLSAAHNNNRRYWPKLLTMATQWEGLVAVAANGPLWLSWMAPARQGQQKQQQEALSFVLANVVVKLNGRLLIDYSGGSMASKLNGFVVIYALSWAKSIHLANKDDLWCDNKRLITRSEQRNCISIV